jgi:hypothetical protein
MKKRILGIIIISLLLIPSFSLAMTNNENINEYEKYDTDSIIINYNTPPDPPVINGTFSGKAGKTYEYSFTLIDPDEDDYLMFLEIDFGSEIVVIPKRTCESPWYSGTILYATYKWKEEGNYSISARVLDSYGEWSEWSDPIPITMPKSHNNIFQSIIHRLIERYSLLQIIFQT